MAKQQEGKLAGKIIAALEKQGWLAWKTHGGAYTSSGIPDVLGFRFGSQGPESLAIEVKLPGNEPTALQKKWLRDLSRCGVRAGVATEVDEALEISGDL